MDNMKLKCLQVCPQINLFLLSYPTQLYLVIFSQVYHTDYTLLLFLDFKGDFSKLDPAEKFMTKVMEIPQYQLHIEATLLRVEFNQSAEYIEASLKTLECAMRGSDSRLTTRFTDSQFVYFPTTLRINKTTTCQIF